MKELLVALDILLFYARFTFTKLTDRRVARQTVLWQIGTHSTPAQEDDSFEAGKQQAVNRYSALHTMGDKKGRNRLTRFCIV